jgi:bifunctional DNA-binding transcriptional regulator/antitoxin component of YhaV-PrlF toxin-antitoxin module
MNATVIDKKRRMTLPESVCEAVGLKPNDQVEWRVEAGEIRGRRLVEQKPIETFPPGSLLKYFTPERDKEELSILSGCVKGPE